MQHARTAAAVSEYCDVFSSAETELAALAVPRGGFDLVHVYNAGDPDETWRRIQVGHALGKPVVLSTIWWSMEELYLEWARRGWRDETAQREAWQARVQAMARLFRQADLLLPNSHAEYGLLVGQYGTTKPYRVVPNAVDPAFADLCHASRSREGSLLCVGRIELRKNQLGLLEAMENSDYPILFVGDENPQDVEHTRACRRLARLRGNVAFISATRDRRAICSLMKSCAVYVQPSFYETPGLAALEAGLCGAPVVVSDRGCTREYFGDLAYYCDPADPASIRHAVTQALHRPRPGFADRIREEFNWDRAARETVAAYQQAVQG